MEVKIVVSLPKPASEYTICTPLIELLKPVL